MSHEKNSKRLVHFSSVDMTLALGADSYLRQHGPHADGLVSDPVGRQCFTKLVDLVLNSEVCFLTLPSDAHYASQPILIERLSALKTIPRCATVRLKRSVERKIVRAFWSTLESLGHDWVSQWFSSQFWNPIVTKHHHPRLGSEAHRFTTMSDEGWDIWCGSVDVPNLALPVLSMKMPDEAYIRQDIERAGGLVQFQYGYAFNVFRRGWQYAEASRQTQLDIKYSPHQFRHGALTMASDGWRETGRGQLWSWGRCLAHLVDSSHVPIDIVQVTEWVNGLLEARSPVWTQGEPLDHWLAADTADHRGQLLHLVDQLHEVARAAKIPRSQLRTILPERIAGVTFEVLRDRFHLSTIEAILDALPFQEVIEPVRHHVYENLKDGVNTFQRGTFGYPGLLGEQLNVVAREDSRRPVTLL